MSFLRISNSLVAKGVPEMLFVVILMVVELSGTGISTLFSLVLKHSVRGWSLKKAERIKQVFRLIGSSDKLSLVPRTAIKHKFPEI